MLRISQNIGKYANQFRHSNHYHYFTSQILSQSRCGPQIETNRSTQQSASDVNSCGCAIRINQRVGLCQLGRNNENSAGDAPLRSSCLWVVDKATPWFKEQREQWSSNNKLHSLSDRCKILGITSTAEATKAQMMALQKPILDAQQQRLDPNNFKHISPEFLSLLREHDNLCLQKNPFYGLPEQEDVSQRAPSRSTVTSATRTSAAQVPYNRGTTMCRKMKDDSSGGNKRRSKCKLSSYLAARKRRKETPCSDDADGSKQKNVDPHVPSYNRAQKANRILKSFLTGRPNENRRSRKERYAAEMAWRAMSKPSGFFRHSHNINARRKERRSSRSRERQREISESGFHRHPIDHLRNLKRCDYTTPYFNKQSRSCASLRSRPSSSSLRSSSQNVGFHRRTYLHCLEDTSTKRALNQSSGGVNRTWDYGGTESHGYEMKTLSSGFYRHTYDSGSPILRSRSQSRSRSRSKSKSPPRRPYKSPYRKPSRSPSQSKSSMRSSKSTDGNAGRRRSSCCFRQKSTNQPVRQIYMKPKEVEMRQSRSRCCLKRNKDRGSKDQGSRDRFSKDQGSNDRFSKERKSSKNRSNSKDRSRKKRGSKDRDCQEQTSSRCCLKGNKNQSSKDRLKKRRGSKDRLNKDHGSNDRGSKDRFNEDRGSKERTPKKRSSSRCCLKRKKKPDLSNCCQEPPKKKRSSSRCCLRRSSSKKRQPQVKFRKRSNQYYNEPHVHGYGSDENYNDDRRRRSEGSRTRFDNANKDQGKSRSNDRKKKAGAAALSAGGMACRGKNSDIDVQTDDDICYPPLPISKTQKKRMIEEALNRFTPKPEDNNDIGATDRKGKDNAGNEESASDDGRSSRSSISINDANSSKSYDSLGPFGNKWPSRTASQAPRLPMASKKCGHKLVRDPAAPPRPKLKKKKSWSSCRSSGSSNRSREDVGKEDKYAYILRRRQLLRARETEQNECMWGRRRRKTPLLVNVEGKHHICHKDSTDWTTTTKQYPNHLRKAGMEQRCESLVNCKHRCTTQSMLSAKVSRKEWKQRQHRHDLCRRDSQDWLNAKANYPVSYQLARCTARADAHMLRRHRDKTEQILASGYAPHKQATDSKAKRMQRQQEELGTPKCNHKPKPYPLRPEFYAPKRDFSEDWEALNKHEKCLPPVQRLQLFRKQHEQEAACKRSAAELKKNEYHKERKPRRPPYDPGEEYVQRTLRAEEAKRCKHQRKRANYFLESDDEYYREAEDEERARKTKTKPCPTWHGKKQSVTIVCTPDAKYSYLKHRPTPPPKPSKKYHYYDIDDDEYRRYKRTRGERKWFDEADSRTVVRCVNDRAERRCIRREPGPSPPCSIRPEYTLGKLNRK